MHASARTSLRSPATTSRATSSPTWGLNLLSKVADEIASAKLAIPWLFGSLGVPAAFTGFLVPIREGGVLLPQLAVAAAVRSLAVRKGVWLLGAALSALSLFGMATAALSMEGSAAGGAIGKKVAVIEAARMGGTCVNSGCVPKKVMWYAAPLAHAVDDAAAFGVPAMRGRTDWQSLVTGRDRYIANVSNYWNGYVQAQGIERIEGHARFVDANTVQVNGERYRADHVVIATGSQPIVPPVSGAELGITSDGFFQLQKQPQRVAVIGGGYVGVELAGVLKALGSEVTVVALEGRVLELFDSMISEALMVEMRQQGIELRMSFRVTGLTKTDAGIAVDSSRGEHRCCQ